MSALGLFIGALGILLARPQFDHLGITFTLKEIGVSAGVFRAMLSVNESGDLRFNARVRVGIASVSAGGTIDVEQLLVTCSGVLCRAARALSGRPAQVDRQLREALGN